MQPGSSSGLWKSWTYGCSSASLAESHFFGLNYRSFLSRSSASSEAVGNISLNGFAFAAGSDSSIVEARLLYTASISSWLGRPVTSIILSSWFSVLVPGKNGLPNSNSARMQPNDHISTPFVYFVEPSKISGALYHQVAT